MREILFRGKRLDNGEWVCGYLICSNDHKRAFIGDLDFDLPERDVVGVDELDAVEVDLNTVDQYTGLTDKNGRKIYEGDIVGAKHPEQIKAVPCLVGFGEFEDVDSLDNYNYSGWFLKVYGKCLSVLEPEKDGIELEVIGNIHDNPGLMGAHNESI